MPPRVDPSTFLPLKTDAVFVMLALESRPMHGYAIIKDVADRSAGEVMLQAGALYRLLRRLLHDDLIVECDQPVDEVSNDERRRYYRVSPLGRAVLEADVARMKRLVEAAGTRRIKQARSA